MAANKLLLIDDVESLGLSGEIVSVRPGYARNYLIPQGLAVVANKGALKMQAKLQEERKKKAAKDRQESETVANQLDNLVLEITVKVDHEGHMYGSVSVQDIQSLIEKEKGINLEKRSIQLKHAIKATGTHSIPIKLKEGVTVETVTLKVVSEQGEASQ